MTRKKRNPQLVYKYDIGSLVRHKDRGCAGIVLRHIDNYVQFGDGKLIPAYKIYWMTSPELNRYMTFYESVLRKL